MISTADKFPEKTGPTRSLDSDMQAAPDMAFLREIVMETSSTQDAQENWTLFLP